jgi:hypothetical protein
MLVHHILSGRIGSEMRVLLLLCRLLVLGSLLLLQLCLSRFGRMVLSEMMINCSNSKSGRRGQ